MNSGLTMMPAPCKKGGPIHIAFPKVDGVRSFSSSYSVVVPDEFIAEKTSSCGAKAYFLYLPRL